MKIKKLYVFVFALMLTAFFSCNILKKQTAQNDSNHLYKTSRFIEGFHMKMLGRNNDALDIFKSIADLDNKHSASRYEISKIYAERREFTLAHDYIKQAIKIEPANKWYRLLLIDIYDRTGDHKSKISIYQQLIREFPADMSLYYGLANAYMQLNNLSEAIKVLDEIENIIGVSEEVSIQKYQFYIMTGKNQAAINELKKLSVVFSGDPAYSMAIADFYLQTGNYYEALTYYEAVFNEDNTNYEALISMAECYMRIGNYAKTTELFTILFKDPAVDVDAKMNIIMYYYEMSESDSVMMKEAYQLLDLFILTHPDEAKVVSVYGDFLFRDGRFDEAAGKWKKVVKLDPGKFPVWEHLFICLDMTEDFDSLAEYATRSIGYFPEQPGSHFYAGYAYFRLKKYEKSTGYLKNAADNAVLNNAIKIQALGYLAEAYHHLKNHTLSDEAFEALLETDPSNYWALNNYSFYLAIRGEHLEKALEMSEQTIRHNPRSASYLDTYGWILFKMGQYAEAEEYIRKAVEYSENPSPAILQNYGDVLFKLNRTEESIRYWKLAMDAGGDVFDLQSRINQIMKNE
jgi:tetratricopeptide (TPR) repeat protein